MEKYKSGIILLALSGSILIGGCANSVKATDFKRYDVGTLTRADEAKVISQQHVIISSWWPFGIGLNGHNRNQGDRLSLHRNGITYIVKIERTGEVLSVTQADDVHIENGANAWVQFGDRIRIFPR